MAIWAVVNWLRGLLQLRRALCLLVYLVSSLCFCGFGYHVSTFHVRIYSLGLLVADSLTKQLVCGPNPCKCQLLCCLVHSDPHFCCNSWLAGMTQRHTQTLLQTSLHKLHLQYGRPSLNSAVVVLHNSCRLCD